MRQGLAEWAVVTAVLVLAAAGASALWGDDLRGAFGVRPPAPARPLGAAPALAPAAR